MAKAKKKKDGAEEAPKTEYQEHMGAWESKQDKKENDGKVSKAQKAVESHPKFDKFK